MALIVKNNVIILALGLTTIAGGIFGWVMNGVNADIVTLQECKADKEPIAEQIQELRSIVKENASAIQLLIMNGAGQQEQWS